MFGRVVILFLLAGLAPLPSVAMGIRSFVALPVEQGGAVARLLAERNASADVDTVVANLAYGLNARQTLLLGLPYRLSPSGPDRAGDLSILLRQIVAQQDSRQGTRRVGLLAGLLAPTDSDRSAALRAAAVATFYRQRQEWDLDIDWIGGSGDRPDRARYDVAWQYRLDPARYPAWGTPAREWDLDVELGGRWSQGGDVVHQATVGLQAIHDRWVLEGALVRDLNGPADATRYLLSLRWHL